MVSNRSLGHVPLMRIVSLLVKLLIVCTVLIEAVLGAPQASANNQATRHRRHEDGARKTADLVPLINETLSLSNKSTNADVSANGGHQFKDDWTFDMVEYDLMEFLQDLSARYRQANGNRSLSQDTVVSLGGKRDATHLEELKKDLDRQDLKDANEQRDKFAAQPEIRNNLTNPSNEQLGAKRDLPIAPAATITGSASGSSGPTTSKPEVSSVSFSLASNDHDFAESTWQYGIFDRFTRPRSTSTTTSAPEPIVSSGSDFEVRNFNSDECGLRTYVEEDPNHYPAFEEEQQQTASKELNQRRQRPPLGSSFFASHKKFQASSIANDVLASDNERGDNRPPPFDSNGEPAQSASNGHKFEDDELNKHWPLSSADTSQAADSEFNLSFRRQWLQQQLGQTLSMLGFNASAGKIPFDLFNDTAASYLSSGLGAGLSARENMMKKSTKTAKSIDRLDGAAEPAGAHNPAAESLTEQQLKARQDELKLEARVIGGSDARLGDSPWSVSLQALVARPGTGGVEYRHYCGGTIISEYYILTAAHCLDFMVGREARLFVVVGDLNWRMNAASLHGRRFGIEKLIIHSGYKSTAFGHDIGLIRTKESMRPLKVNGRYIINSVCLPERGVEHSGEAELVGWGLFSNRNEMADSLQIADVPILPRPLCVDLYKRRTGLIQWLIGIELITEKQICAGTFGRGICQGDSGSALVFNEKVSRVFSSSASSASTSQHGRPDPKVHSTRRFSNLARDQQNRATIIGIVAFGGIRRCSYQSLPGVYMQTSKYMDWIVPRIQS